MKRRELDRDKVEEGVFSAMVHRVREAPEMRAWSWREPTFLPSPYIVGIQGPGIRYYYPHGHGLSGSWKEKVGGIMPHEGTWMREILGHVVEFI